MSGTNNQPAEAWVAERIRAFRAGELPVIDEPENEGLAGWYRNVEEPAARAIAEMEEVEAQATIEVENLRFVG